MRNEYDFSKAKRARDIPHLRQLQTAAKGKSCVTIMLDNDVLAQLRERASEKGIECQALILQALIEALGHHRSKSAENSPPAPVLSPKPISLL